MTRLLRHASFAAIALVTLSTGCALSEAHEAPPEPMLPTTHLRLATYNTSLYADTSGGLIERLENDDAGARSVAAVLQRVRPDIVLLNEFDYDESHRAADLFQQRYLEVAQPGGSEPLHYPYRYLAPVNTGLQSGLDLDGNGAIGGEGRERGNDAWGYGLHPGQYGMLVLSLYPIDTEAARTFQLLKWSAMPDARQPRDPATGTPHYPPQIWSQLRLSSKSHWDVPVRTPGGTLHMLAAHPTPPVFDGPEDRNGARNADEIRLWREYISAEETTWLCDDTGHCGGLDADARFVIAGDLNNDPADGDGRHEAILELLEHPRVVRMATPRSEGAVEAAARYSGITRVGDPGHATGDYGPRTGTLRLDYVLPSVGLSVKDSGVFWPKAGEPGAELVEASDHRLVWVDVEIRSER
ncbi:endonuclease/exonuclease/phosphatase family protein [Marilutibacter alkalisoli]|uniref:Endonuclease/exonuclease/phosphatase family protein n=1 Tax=Marilutibacter alkalisoli TaxID=2591633 RepID=A0A514BQK5_9GAMM|nr:endonuclease/exonuclease/phosphatase family protein [Lysobacter alkalisoli]QDH69678.1 endonuclease/exonuclease/phosphatase family protein [Lysobacter alkalisoli]